MSTWEAQRSWPAHLGMQLLSGKPEEFCALEFLSLVHRMKNRNKLQDNRFQLSENILVLYDYIKFFVQKFLRKTVLTLFKYTCKAVSILEVIPNRSNVSAKQCSLEKKNYHWFSDSFYALLSLGQPLPVIWNTLTRLTGSCRPVGPLLLCLHTCALPR